MKCPHNEDFECPFVDTSDMTKDVDCTQCKYRVFTPEETERTEKWNELMKNT